MRKILILAFALTFCLSPMDAQKRKTKKKVVKVEKEVVPEKTPEELRFEEMLPSTAKVMFIDSIVVDKKDFISKLQLSREMGKISIDGERVSYTNEFANTMVYASGDTLTGRPLFITHKYGEKWDTPTRLVELGNADNDYPFFMADGVTLYFSAKGDNTVGGKDIFRTTFNEEDMHFYEAVNMGLPFNSPANDYLLAISDYYNLGWLVSDRFQPEGKVCIYTFEPTSQRKTFDEDTEPETIMPYALLSSIKDTWQFGDRTAALQRKKEMLESIKNKQSEEKVFFVVNDKVTYTSAKDFKNANDYATYKRIVADKKKLEQSRKVLEITRDSYADANETRKAQIGRNIMQLEQEVSTLETNIKKTEKDLRNNLNK